MHGKSDRELREQAQRLADDLWKIRFELSRREAERKVSNLTPEQRRALFRVIKGGAASIGALLALLWQRGKHEVIAVAAVASVVSALVVVPPMFKPDDDNQSDIPFDTPLAPEPPPWVVDDNEPVVPTPTPVPTGEVTDEPTERVTQVNNTQREPSGRPQVTLTKKPVPSSTLTSSPPGEEPDDDDERPDPDPTGLCAKAQLPANVDLDLCADL